jgi:hypothetical protein
MRLPTPGDPGIAPVWDNYVVAQAAQATLGLVPKSALAVGVVIDGTDVQVRFQLSRLIEDDMADMEDIVSGLEALLGEGVHVEEVREIRTEPAISPHDGVRWVFLARKPIA